jgi:ankyrin repeat protein
VISRLTWIDDDASIPDGFTILTPPAETTVFPQHNRIVRIDNLPWVLFNQKIHLQDSFQRLLSDSMKSMKGRHSDIIVPPFHYPILESLEATYTPQGLVPCPNDPTTSSLDNMAFNLESRFDSIPYIGLSWDFLEHQLNEPVRTNTNSDFHSAFLTVLWQQGTKNNSEIKSLKSIYKTYMVEKNQVERYTTFDPNNNHSWDPTSNPSLYQLFSLFMFMVTNNLLHSDEVQEIYVWAKSNSCIWLFTEILRLESTTVDVFATKLFTAAVQVGDVEMVRKLVSRNVSIDTPIHGKLGDIRTALSCAVGEGNMQLVRVLCELGAKPAVHWIDSMAFTGGRASLWSPQKIGILHLLLNYGADPERLVLNQPRGFPLIQAASGGSVEAVSLLLAAGANVNLSIPLQWGTALQASAAGGHVQVVRALLEAKADVNTVHIVGIDPDGCVLPPRDLDGLRTPLQLAARDHDSETALLLLQSGALINFCPISSFAGLEWIDRQFAFWEEGFSVEDETLPLAFAIQYAAQYSNISLVHHLLAAGAMVDSRIGIEYGDTPLQIAARLGNVELVSLLLAYNADSNAAPGKYNDRTAIQAAAESVNIKVIQMLLDAHANVHASPGWRRGRTALQAALEKGHINAARRLLLAGADINANPGFSKGLTALQAAVSFGDIEIVRELLSYGADINAASGPEGGLTALQAAMRHKNIDLLTLLLQVGADVNALPSKLQNKTALQCAVAMDWMEGVQLLLAYNPDVHMLPPYQGGFEACSALGWAINNKNHDMMVLLLNHGAGPNDPVINNHIAPLSAFIYALNRLNMYESIELFVEKGADVNVCWGSRSAFSFAIAKAPANVEVVRIMIQLISQSTRNQDADWIEKSLTWITIDQGEPVDIKLLQLLLDAGADINAKSPDKEMTILQKCSKYGSTEVVEFLLRNGAEANIPATKYMGTPLQEAIKSQGTETAELLLEYDADVNAPPANRYGVTALQAAAIHGYIPLALKLLERGADVAAAPSPHRGRTAIDGAAEHGHLDMLQLLLNAYGDREGLASVCSHAASFAEEECHVAIAVWLRGYAAS